MRVVLTGPRSADVDGRLLLDPPVDPPAPSRGPRPSATTAAAPGRPGYWHDPSAPHDGPPHAVPAPSALRLHTSPGPGRDRPWTGDRRHAAGLTVLAVPAGLPGGGPDPERVALVVTDEAGGRLLWAPSGLPLPAATLSALRGLHLDLVFLGAPDGSGSAGPRGLQGVAGLLEDEGPALLHEVARLRDVGAVDERTEVTVLPPARSDGSLTPADAWRLPWAASVSGAVEVAVPGRPYASAAAPDRAAPRPVGRAAGLARRVLVLGPAAGGKSAYAEALVAAEPHVTYLATGPDPSPDDTEWTDRVDRHRRRRPAWWSTAEAASTDALVDVLATATGTVLWDSAGTWLVGVLDRHDAWTGTAGWRERVDAEAERAVAALAASSARVVVVSEEVGWGVVPDTPSGRLFRDLLGAFNQRLAWDCDDVLLVVAGRALPMPAAQAPVTPSALPASAVTVVAEVALDGGERAR